MDELFGFTDISGAEQQLRQAKPGIEGQSMTGVGVNELLETLGRPSPPTIPPWDCSRPATPAPLPSGRLVVAAPNLELLSDMGLVKQAELSQAGDGRIRDMAEFHEIYQEGKHIHEQLMKLWAETRELQKQRAIEKLKLFE